MRQSCSGWSGEMPSTRISPCVGRISPVIRFMSVVLPEPFGPTRLVMPGGIDRFTLVDAQHLAVEARDVGEGDRRESRVIAPPPRRGSCAPACTGRSAQSPASAAQQHHSGSSSPCGTRKKTAPLVVLVGAFEELHPDRADQVADVEQVAPVGALHGVDHRAEGRRPRRTRRTSARRPRASTSPRPKAPAPAATAAGSRPTRRRTCPTARRALSAHPAASLPGSPASRTAAGPGTQVISDIRITSTDILPSTYSTRENGRAR